MATTRPTKAVLPEKNEYRKMPASIKAKPEDVAKAIMQGPPKKKWRFQTQARGHQDVTEHDVIETWRPR